jgi:ATP-dependent DNA helicase 2 subunit 2
MRFVVPKRVAKTRKDGHAHAEDQDDDLLLLERKATVERAPARPESKLNLTQALSSSKLSPQKSFKRDGNDSDTEDDEEEELLLDLEKPTGEENLLPTPARSFSPTIDPGRAPGRIIGTTWPLKDFEKNTAQGDVVTKAVQDLANVIVEVVLKPFASRRHGEMIECMKVLRQTCLEVCVTSYRSVCSLLKSLILRRMKLMHGILSYVI